MTDDRNPVPPVPDLNIKSVEDALGKLVGYLGASNAILEFVAVHDAKHGDSVERLAIPLISVGEYVLADLYGRAPDFFQNVPRMDFAGGFRGGLKELASTYAPGVRALVEYLEGADHSQVQGAGGATRSQIIRWRVHPLWDTAGYLLAEIYAQPSHTYSAGGGGKPG